MPLLHRPTFDKSVKKDLYLTDQGFAPVFLLVCAIGARYSDDPRVLSDRFDSYHSSGWKWFEQVQTMKRSLITPATLYDLQVYCVRIIQDWFEAQLMTMITAIHRVPHGFFSAVMLVLGWRCYSIGTGCRRASKKTLRC